PRRVLSRGCGGEEGAGATGVAAAGTTIGHPQSRHFVARPVHSPGAGKEVPQDRRGERVMSQAPAKRDEDKERSEVSQLYACVRACVNTFHFRLIYSTGRIRPLFAAKGHGGTAPGRRPFRGAAGTASVVTPRAGGPRLSGLEGSRDHAHAWLGLSADLVW